MYSESFIYHEKQVIHTLKTAVHIITAKSDYIY